MSTNSGGGLILLGVGALVLLSLRKKATPDSATDDDAPTTADEVERIVSEAREIVQGKRDAFSDVPDSKVSAREAAERVKATLEKAKAGATGGATKTEQDAAIAAARAAAAVEAAAKASSSPPTPYTPPVPRPKPVAVDGRDPMTRPPPPGPPPGPVYPEGFDRAKAMNAAPDVARNIKNKKYDYNRKALKLWQRLAGIAQDGIYGRGSAAALRFYIGGAAPKPLYAQGTDSYPWGNP
jgi:hypothetical protein